MSNEMTVAIVGTQRIHFHSDLRCPACNAALGKASVRYADLGFKLVCTECNRDVLAVGGA
jgi:hypothetical protein